MTEVDSAGGLHTGVDEACRAGITIAPWPDRGTEFESHDPRSCYVEHFWLPVIGPAATWLLRHLAYRFDAEPDGFDLDPTYVARALGIGGRGGRRATLAAALRRCERFNHLRASSSAPGVLEVRRRLSPVPQHDMARLPLGLQLLHEQYVQRDQPSKGSRDGPPYDPSFEPGWRA